MTDVGVGVPSCDVDCMPMLLREGLVGVGVTDEIGPKFSAMSIVRLVRLSRTDTVSSSGVSSGTTVFQLETGMPNAWSGDGGYG